MVANEHGLRLRHKRQECFLATRRMSASTKQGARPKTMQSQWNKHPALLTLRSMGPWHTSQTLTKHASQEWSPLGSGFIRFPQVGVGQCTSLLSNA